jgi:hypothetical protein
LKIIDQFDDLYVHAYCTQGNFMFVLLTTKRDEQSIRNFFENTHEIVVKIRMSPFFDEDEFVCDGGVGFKGGIVCTNASFDAKVREIARVLG